MVKISRVFSHFIKAVFSYQCMKYMFTTKRIKDHLWLLHGYQILFVHCMLGIMQFGTSIHKSPGLQSRLFRKLYDWWTGFIDAAFVTCVAMDILQKYEVDDYVIITTAIVAILPMMYLMCSVSVDSDIRRNTYLVDLTIPLLLSVIVSGGLGNGNLLVMVFVPIYAFHCYLVDKLCSHCDIPEIDIKEYSLAFCQFFAVLIIRHN